MIYIQPAQGHIVKERTGSGWEGQAEVKEDEDG